MEHGENSGEVIKKTSAPFLIRRWKMQCLNLKLHSQSYTPLGLEILDEVTGGVQLICNEVENPNTQR